MQIALFNDGHNRQQHEQTGKGHPGINEALDRQVELASQKSGHSADEHGRQHTQGGDGKAHANRDLRAVQ